MNPMCVLTMLLVFHAASSYADLIGGSAHGIWTIDSASGDTFHAGATGIALSALAFDTTTGTLFGSGLTVPEVLYSIDVSTGQATAIANMGVAIYGLAYDPGADTLIGTSRQLQSSNSLWAIDKSTGATEQAAKRHPCQSVEPLPPAHHQHQFPQTRATATPVP